MKRFCVIKDYKWRYSDKWPYNGMVNDLYRGIQAGENYLVALGLFCYSEALGWEYTNKKSKDFNAYKIFTEKFVGYKFDNLEEIYKDSRNGLAHRYFIKNRFGTINNDNGNMSCGIVVNSESDITINIRTYFKHFVIGLESMLDECTN